MNAAQPAPGHKDRGALIVALMAGIAIMMILSTVAVQQWSDVVRRDAEAEMIFRAQDIVRALRRYQADRGQLPTELSQLLEVGQRKPQYLIRQLWKDPLVKGGKWQLIYANPAGGFIDPTTAPVGGMPGVPGQPGQPGQTGQTGQPGQTGMTGMPTSVLSSDGTFPPIGGKKSDEGGDFSGMPIAGVKSRCSDHPFRRYRDKVEYSEWIFTIFDLEPNGAAMNRAPTAQPSPIPPGPVTPGGPTPAKTQSLGDFPPH